MERCYLCWKTENNPGDGVLDVSECESCGYEYCDNECFDAEKEMCKICLGKGPVDKRDIT